MMFLMISTGAIAAFLSVSITLIQCRNGNAVSCQVKPRSNTTALKMLQIITEKGLVQREEQGRLHIYEAVRSKPETQRQLLLPAVAADVSRR
jgi:hypothetical protein